MTKEKSYAIIIIAIIGIILAGGILDYFLASEIHDSGYISYRVRAIENNRGAYQQYSYYVYIKPIEGKIIKFESEDLYYNISNRRIIFVYKKGFFNSYLMSWYFEEDNLWK